MIMPRPEKTYKFIAGKLAALNGCNPHWTEQHTDQLDYVMNNYSPSGAGIDSGTKLSSKSSPEKLIFDTAYHHMNDGGYYDGWTEHQVIVTSSLVHGINIRITGTDRNQIKDYLHQVFSFWLGELLDWDEKAQKYVRVKEGP